MPSRYHSVLGVPRRMRPRPRRAAHWFQGGFSTLSEARRCRFGCSYRPDKDVQIRGKPDGWSQLQSGLKTCETMSRTTRSPGFAP